MRIAQCLGCIVALTVPVWGVCLLNDYSVQAEYSRSTAVVIGEPVSERSVPDREDVGFYGGIIYTVKISETLRGALHGKVEVFSENTSGRFPMEKGKKYILFLSKDQKYLSADNCGNSGLVAEKHDVLSAVRTIAKQSHPR